MADPHGLDRVEEAMRQAAPAGPLGESLAHHLRAGGKRLRARLALTTGEAFGLAASDAAAWATACELLHNATLVHDDLCDRDPTRRGQASVWAGFGDTAALCLGDLLLAEAIAAIDPVAPAGPRRALRRLLLDTVRALTHGQALEGTAAAGGVPDLPACREVADHKTVPLVTLPVAGVLAMAGTAEAPRHAALEAFALLGRAYQVLDDLEDLLGHGQDLKRQVPNHGLAGFAEQADPALRSALDRDWRSGAIARAVPAWLVAIRASPALSDGLDRAEALLVVAESAMEGAPAAVQPGFRMVAGHLRRQAADLRAWLADGHADRNIPAVSETVAA